MNINLSEIIKTKEKHLISNLEFNNNTDTKMRLEDIALLLKQKCIEQKRKIKILELGTKRSNNDNPTHHKKIFEDIPNLEYIMTDIEKGVDVDVDVISDLHSIDKNFEKNYFDCIISCSTFEHLKYPQLCSHNLMKILDIDGIIFIQTHQSFFLHGYKYDYYRFSREALISLFSQKMKFKTLSSYFEFDCLIIPHDKSLFDKMNTFAESYLNVVLCTQKIDETPIDYIYDLDFY